MLEYEVGAAVGAAPTEQHNCYRMVALGFQDKLEVRKDNLVYQRKLAFGVGPWRVQLEEFQD